MIDPAMSSGSVFIHRGSLVWLITSSIPLSAQYSATRNCSTSCCPKPGKRAPETRLSMAVRHRITRSRLRRRAFAARSGALPSQVVVSVSTTLATASPALRQNTSTDRLRERTGSSGRITHSETVTQAKPTVEASTNHPIRSLVMRPAPARKVISAPITARLRARRLQERSAYDKNICKTRSATAAHTAVRLSSAVTTIATAETTAAQPNV